MTSKSIAIVTGAAGGIGKEICISLLSEGYIVCGLDLSEQDYKQLTNQGIEQANYYHYIVDLSKDSEVRNIVTIISEQFGSIDVLINNAGWDNFLHFEKTNIDEWQKITSINLIGTLSTTHAVLPFMKLQGGSILCVSSDAGRIGSSGEAVYAACKAGVIGFSKSLAREVAKYNIRVNVVCPGPTSTKLLDKVLQGTGDAEKASKSFLKAIPLRRFGEPKDISNSIMFLISEKSNYITGQVLSVSGGLTMVD